MSLTIILPSYNEKENISDVIKGIGSVFKTLNVQGEVIVVDDGSPDGTARHVENLQKEFRGLRLIRRAGKFGIASAVRAGCQAASFPIVIVMDSDGSHPPEVIPQMVELIEKTDLVSGSRYKGGQMRAPFHKIFASVLINFLSRRLLGSKIYDYTGGFFLFDKNLFLNTPIKSSGGEYAVEFLHSLQRRKAKIQEIPISYRYRRGGRSKTHIFKDGWRYIRLIFDLRFRPQPLNSSYSPHGGSA